LKRLAISVEEMVDTYNLYIRPFDMKTNTGPYTVAIVLSAFIAWLLAMTANLNKMELGALFNIFIPPVMGVICIVLLLLISIFKNGKASLIAAIALCSFNLYIGLLLHFERWWFPLNLL